MGNISTDQKLHLVQMIREENRDNRMKMRSREKMLYGTDSRYDKYESEELPLYTKGYYEGGKLKREKELFALEEDKNEVNFSFLSSFKLRFVLAIILFTAYLILDSGGQKVAGFTTDRLREEINSDFDSNLEEVVFDFEHNFPYTLFSNN